MLAQVKKLAGGDVAGRFGAWWSGREYVAGEADAVAETADAGKPVAAKLVAAKPVAVAPEPAPAPVAETAVVHTLSVVANSAPAPAVAQVVDGAVVRIRALETLWGEGRLAPGSFSLDTRIIDAVLELANQPGDIGFIGADSAMLNAFAAQSERRALATEWRTACVSRLRETAPSAVITAGEVDRPRGFEDHSMPAIASVEAFAYADHKAGLVGRVFRALNASGRWVFLDTTRTTKKTPPAAFASAWAEPQLSTSEEVEELLMLAGFKTVRRMSASDLVLSAAKQGYANLSQVLENAASSGLTGREGALFLQELAWEAQSWRARTRAIEGGALEVNLWVADKTVQAGPLKFALNQVIGADDAGAADALFDRA